MKIYLVTSGLSVHAGLLLLNKAQANRRNHVLVKQNEKIDSLNLSDEEQAFIKPADEHNTLAVYKVIGTTQFKVGEKIGYDGELNKVTAQMLTPVEDIEPEEESEPEIDEALLNAITELDPENDAHWTRQDKPEIAVLSGLLKRKVTGKERDEAYACYLQRQDELVEAIGVLDKENTEHWTDENKPSVAELSDIVGREVGDDECERAFLVFEHNITANE